MLYVIGLGLGNEKDITIRGLEDVKRCEKVYMEAYTSLLSLPILQAMYCKPITIAYREMVEEKADEMRLEASSSDVAFLVVGDPFGATTHTDGISHERSGCLWLATSSFWETVSIPFFTATWRRDSFYGKIQRNRNLGLHTLCLLDIHVKEPTLKSLCRGKKQYEPPRYLSINTAIEQLAEIEEEQESFAYDKDTICVGLARLGSEDQKVMAGPMGQLRMVDFGEPLHYLVITGETHPIEEEMLDFYKLQGPFEDSRNGS